MSAPRSISALTLSLALALALGACGKTEAPAAKEGGAAKGPSPIAAVMFGSGSSDQGEALFGRECAFCHVGKSTGALMLGRRLGKENADLTKRTDLQADYVKAVHIYADGNPQPGIVSYSFTPACGKASAATRMRLAQTQNIVCVAEMSNGALHMAKANVKVTIGGCGG